MINVMQHEAAKRYICVISLMLQCVWIVCPHNRLGTDKDTLQGSTRHWGRIDWFFSAFMQLE